MQSGAWRVQAPLPQRKKLFAALLISCESIN